MLPGPPTEKGGQVFPNIILYCVIEKNPASFPETGESKAP